MLFSNRSWLALKNCIMQYILYLYLEILYQITGTAEHFYFFLGGGKQSWVYNHHLHPPASGHIYESWNNFKTVLYLYSTMNLKDTVCFEG